MTQQHAAVQHLAADPYFDEQGRPQLVDSFVLFLDLLGTRSPRTGTEGQDYLRAVREAVQRATARSLSCSDALTGQGATHWFSDNLATAHPVDVGWAATSPLALLVTEAGYLQLAFAESGLFARGGIARDLFFADVQFIHGPALERAVALEHARARFPRAVLDEASIATARHGLFVEDGGGRGSPWRRQLAVDEEGVVFVNYLSTLLEDPAGEGLDIRAGLQRHKSHVESRLHEHDGVEGVEDKYRWLASYHNYFVGSLELRSADQGDLFVSCSRPLGAFRDFGDQ